ncbi:hypothetical protein THTE_2966 [Thermogutta terrifontis]|uniref:Uncharacterized protein n=1 Tax=Thermogutta terrifontis TaxID=1331910 RepID=A0A286RHY2_9BACT|nr:hypothetical protein THTE_2966 [Thermogutta terrifontis]
MEILQLLCLHVRSCRRLLVTRPNRDIDLSRQATGTILHPHL